MSRSGKGKHSQAKLDSLAVPLLLLSNGEEDIKKIAANAADEEELETRDRRPSRLSCVQIKVLACACA